MEEEAKLNMELAYPYERKIVRLPPQVVCELAYERSEVANNLEKTKQGD